MAVARDHQVGSGTRLDAHARLRVRHCRGNIVHQMLQRRTTAGTQKAAPGVVSVDIDHGLALQLLRVSLRPLRRAEQPRLFAVPACVHERSLRPPSRAQQFSDRLRFGQHRDVTR